MKNYVYRLLLLLTVLALAGCGEKKAEAVAGEAYKIYYLNTSVTKLAPYEYHTETTDTELLIQELMEQFLKVPNDVDSQAALSDKVDTVATGWRSGSCICILTAVTAGSIWMPPGRSYAGRH